MRIRARCSLISAGTERMLVDFGKASLLGKARQQPDRARDVFHKMGADGISATLKSVQAKLNNSIPMGYSSVGVIDALDNNVTGFSIGDRVVSNGPHAEFVVSKKHLVAQIPANVSDENASFTIVSAIALHGIRLANLALGEKVAIIGLGLIGLLAVQILRAQGCQVIGFDYDKNRLALAQEFGAVTVDLSDAEAPGDHAMSFTFGYGVDATFITTATDSEDPIRLAASMTRKKGRIILIGTAGLNLSRDQFYKKELTFMVSCSYGPGRYDHNYENLGLDYPFAYVRWTEKRNFDAVLQLMADGVLDPSKLITHRFEFEKASDAYSILSQEKTSKIGIILEYPKSEQSNFTNTKIKYQSETDTGVSGSGKKLAFIGAGNYATNVLIPAFKSADSHLHSISSQHGLSAANAARRFGFAEATSDVTEQINGSADAVVITTRHDTHAKFVEAAIQAGKHVFVEKPLCITFEELTAIEKALRKQKQPLIMMVGFNRRFSPLVTKMKSLLSVNDGPKTFIYTVNAGAIPKEHWTQDKKSGGGRLIGEACHFIDLLRFLAASPIESITSTKMDIQTEDAATITMRFTDGSMGTIHYLPNGHRSIEKERLEVFVSGRVLRLDNFRRLKGYGWRNFSRASCWTQDKGQRACVTAFLNSLKVNGPPPIPEDEIFEVMRGSFDAANCT